MDDAVKPDKVILVARNAAAAAEEAKLLEEAGIKTSTYIGDLSKPKDCFTICKDVVAQESKLHILMVNAGNFRTDKGGRILTEDDNLEFHFALNYLHMVIFVEALTALLASTATASGNESRVAVMGSYTTFEFAKGLIDIDNLHGKEGPCDHPQGILPQAMAYATSKLMQHMWVKHVHTTLPDNVKINVVCPGAVFTNIGAWQSLYKSTKWIWWVVSWALGMRDSYPEGCATIMFAAGSKKMAGVGGHFVDWGHTTKALQTFEAVPVEYNPSAGQAVSPHVADVDMRRRLVEETDKVLSGLREKYGA